MSFKYIRGYYGVPAKRGVQVKYTGDVKAPIIGTVISAKGPYLRVRFPKPLGGVMTLHPTWCVEYI